MRLELMEKRSRFDDFEKEYRDSKAYLHRAKLFLEQGQDHSVVFNVASLALERYLVALCYLHDMEPYNHNYTCLMDTVEMFMKVPEELNKEIRSLDKIFDICTLDDYFHGDPEVSDMERILVMCEEVEGLFDQKKIQSFKESLLYDSDVGE
ncbi:HEPN domain-containing protein [Methanolobus vulcani]|jgi:HEPN domain.|uniref:HEPN domain-containing protein n=1 Tax=Methanolobus vulcani TaxID=38026 RepID=A0A7Z7FCY1_9EURY|nr:HEPN domain-containing protein [Methanolobus vulcani]SDF96922.1 HEPN domain-containing protein [Methanolobus vulcani]